MCLRLVLLGAVLGACDNLRWIKSPVIQWVVPEGPVTAVSSATESEDLCEDLITVAADGVWLALGGGRNVSIWPMPNCTVGYLDASCVQEEEPWHRMTLPTEVTILQAMDYDVLAVVAGNDVTLWNSRELRKQAALQHAGRVLAMDVEPGWVLTGTTDGNITMWYLLGSEDPYAKSFSGIPVWSYSISDALPELVYEITCLALSRGGHFLAVAVWEPKTLTGRALVWDSTFARMPDSLVRSYAFISRILSMRFSEPQTYILTGTEHGIISSWRHGEDTDFPFATRTAGWPVRVLEFAGNGNWLLGGNGRGSAKVWLSTSLFQGDFQAASFDLEGGGAAALTADDGFILMSRGCDTKLQQVYAWPLNLRGHAISFTFGKSTDGNREMLLSPNGQYLLTANLDASMSGRIRLWSVEPDTNEPIFSMVLEGFYCCMMAVGEEHVLTGSRPSNEDVMHVLTPVKESSYVQLWHLPWSQTTKPGHGFSAKPTGTAVQVPQCDLMSFALSFDQQQLICGCRTKVLIMTMPSDDTKTAEVLKVIPLFGGEAATTVLSFGQTYAVGTSSGSVCLEDTSHCFYPGSEITALVASSDATEIYSGSTNGRVCRFFVANMASGSCFSQPGMMPNNVLSLVLQGKDRIASSSTNGVLAVWNLNLTAFTDEKPLVIFHTTNNHMRMVLSKDWSYYYTSGTAGYIQAYLVDSIPRAVQLMKQSRICRPPGLCYTDSVQYHSPEAVAMPSCLQTLPLRLLSLQGAKIDVMGPRPPYSLRKVNLSGSWLSDWRSMRSGWWSIPSVIDVTNTGGYVSIPILHGQAMRLVTDQNCINAAAVKEQGEDLEFCMLRGYQKEGQLCAEYFNSHDMTREALAAHVKGAQLPILTRILVDPKDFTAWLCDCPRGRFGHNGSYCMDCPENHYCPAAGSDTVAKNRDPVPCPPNSGTTQTGSSNVSDCECLPGFYASGIEGPENCQQCPPGMAANSYGQTACQECNFGYRTYANSSDKRSSLCYPDLYGLAFLAVLQLAMIQLAWICWRHFGGLPINDVSQQNGRWIVSACGRRILWILPWLPNTYYARFSRTGNPGLDNPEEPIKVIAIPGIGQRFAILEPGEKPASNREFNRGGYLRRSTTDVMEEGENCAFSSLDTSKGRIYLQCPAVLISGRLFPSGLAMPILSLLAWPLLIQARERQSWLLLGLVSTAVIAAIVIAIAAVSAPRPAIQANLSNFRSLLPKPERVPRGGQRALEVESISNLLVQFQFFIGNRNMYYVSTNILLPITEPMALSFAEMVGPKQTKYFVSHYWGTSFEHAMHSIIKHAQLAEGRRWKHAPYWICSFSNNQWDIEQELGSGDLVESSFYLALTDPQTCATVMLLDEEAKALTRVWCLFEVLQTCLLSQRRPDFQGLLLCTPSGVLNKDAGQSGGSVSIDTAIAVAQTLKNLRLEDAAATNPADKEMIDALVERYPGKHQAMNRFVRAQIRNALRLIKEKHNQTFVKLLLELERSEAGHRLDENAFAGGIPNMQWKRSSSPETENASARSVGRRSAWGWGQSACPADSSDESEDTEELSRE